MFIHLLSFVNFKLRTKKVFNSQTHTHFLSPYVFSTASSIYS